jgi:hypothetical protein
VAYPSIIGFSTPPRTEILEIKPIERSGELEAEFPEPQKTTSHNIDSIEGSGVPTVSDLFSVKSGGSLWIVVMAGAKLKAKRYRGHIT